MAGSRCRVLLESDMRKVCSAVYQPPTRCTICMTVCFTAPGLRLGRLGLQGTLA